MDPRAALARLAPGSVSLVRIGRGTAGLGLTPEDVAAAMARVPRMAALLLRAKYAGDDTVLPELARDVTVVTLNLWHSKRWSASPDIKRATDLARLALDHVISPRLCRSCQGRGHRLRRVLEPCPVCSGTGAGEATEAERARALGVHPSNWARTWSSRWRAVVSGLEEMEHRGLSVMACRLGSG